MSDFPHFFWVAIEENWVYPRDLTMISPALLVCWPPKVEHVGEIATIHLQSQQKATPNQICGYTIIYPIGSMYGIYANIFGILMVNVAIYGMHGSYGYDYDPSEFVYLIHVLFFFVFHDF